MKNLLWVGDAACPSGFALATHKIIEGLLPSYNVTVLGLNYRGDPYKYPYPIYAAGACGDSFGIGRLIWMCDLVKPDVIVIQNDGWNIPLYMHMLKRFPEHADIPVVAAVAVDGLNFRGEWLADVVLAVFWTEFGKKEARKGGYTGPAVVIPLGVDLQTYYPADQEKARARRLPSALQEAFIVGNVNRNQSRKRLDLTIRYYAEWTRTRQVKDSYLYLHVAPTGDEGCDVKQLARYYGVVDRLALMEPQVWYGIPEDAMRDTYNCFDAQMTTTQGEGFGLTTFEGMACGVRQIVPGWSALGELCAGAAYVVPCTSTAVGPPYVNVIGGVPDEIAFLTALDKCYPKNLLRFGDVRARVEEPRFRWENIGVEWMKALDFVLGDGELLRVDEEVLA